MRYLILFIPVLLAAQTADVAHISATRASVYIRGASGTCTGTLTNVDDSEVHPYVNAVDLSTLADYVTWSDGTRVVTLGREAGDDALRAETNYSLAISGCMTATRTFRTPTVYFGSRPARPVPWNNAKFGNRDWPNVDMTRAGRHKIYTDPLTGAQVKFITPTGDFGSMEPMGNSGNDFQRWAGGTNWTDPANVAVGSSSVYGSVSTTDPLDLFIDTNDLPWYNSVTTVGVFPDSMGMLVYGSGTDATAVNRQFKVGLYDGTGYWLHQTIELNTGAVAHRQSTSTDAAKPWPSAFPDGGWNGWTVSRVPTKADLPLSGATDSAASVTGTVDGPFTITGSNNTLVLAIDSGSNQTVTFTTGTRTTQNIVDEINAQTTGVTASASGSRVRLTSDTSRNCPTECSALMSVASTIARDASSTALSVLGFTSGTTTGGNGGRITVSSGNTLLWDGTVSLSHRIPLATKAGSKVWVKNSSCPNEICTVASVVDYRTITISETISDGSYSIGYAVYPFWVRVEKTTATGTISLGLRQKSISADRMQPTASRYGAECGPWAGLSDGTRTGDMCLVLAHGGPNGSLYFMPHDFSAAPRMLSRFFLSLTGRWTGWNASDIPTGGDQIRTEFHADKSNPGVWYALSPVPSSKRSLIKVQYDLTKLNDEWAPGYILNRSDGLDTPGANAAGFDNVTFTNIMKPSGGVECGRGAGTGCDLGAQIAARALTDPTLSDPEWQGLDWNTGSVELTAVTGGYAFLRLWQSQDRGPCLLAVVRLSDGQLVNAFSSGKGVTIPGYNSRLRWGACHSTFPGIFDGSLWISQNDLGHVSSGGLWGGPFVTTPSHIKMGNGSWVAVGVDRDGVGGQTSTGTAMEWPTGDPANNYDRACPTDIADWLKDYGATGTQCATFRIPNDPTCTSCTNPATSMALEVGDKLGKAGNYDSEKLRVVKITSLGGTEKEIVVSRNATFDRGCMNNDPDSPRSIYCGNIDSNLTWADGFSFRTESGQTNSSNDTTTNVILANDGSGKIVYIGEASQSSSGHIAYGEWTNGQKLFSGFTSSRILTTQADFDTKYPMGDGVIANSVPKFGTNTAGVGDGKVQAYFNRSHATASASDLRWTLDHNALNPNDGSGTNIGARTITSKGGDIYEIDILSSGTFNYKRTALLGWASFNALKDISSPTADLTTADDYTMCYPYRSGETCGVASPVVGGTKAYVRVPRVNTTVTTCNTGDFWSNAPCAYAGGPSSGFTRRHDAAMPDSQGRFNQDLSMAFVGPGMQPGYSSTAASPAGTWAATVTNSYINGVRAPVALIKMPSFVPGTVRNDYGGLSVNIGPRTGMTHARVRFGYNSSFYCTERSEACLTDGALTPFAYSGDTLTNVACDGATGCTIPVPAIPGRLLYYRLETYDGSVWSNGDTLTAVP